MEPKKYIPKRFLVFSDPEKAFSDYRKAIYRSKRAAEGKAPRIVRTREERLAWKREQYRQEQDAMGRKKYVRMVYTAVEQAMIDEAPTKEEKKSLKKKFYYQKNRERQLAKVKAWHANKPKDYFPKRLARFKNAAALYKAEKQIKDSEKRRKQRESMSPEELLLYKMQQAKRQRERRERNPEKVREYLRTYLLKWRQENPDRIKEINERSRIKKMIKDQVEQEMKNRKTRKKK